MALRRSTESVRGLSRRAAAAAAAAESPLLRELSQRASDDWAYFGGEEKECPLCICAYPAEDTFIFSACNHEVCRGCAREYLKSSYAQRNWPVVCPHTGCSESVDRDDWEVAGIGAAQLEAIDAWALKASLARSTDWRPCPGPDCPNGVVWSEAAGGSAEFRCGACGTTSCVRCRVPWHRGMTCEEFAAERRRKAEEAQRVGDSQRGGDGGIAALLRAGTMQLCPHCGSPTQRAAGCDHIRCRQCGRDWMWREPAAAAAAAARVSSSQARAYAPTPRTREEWARAVLVVALSAGTFALGWHVRDGRVCGGWHMWYCWGQSLMLLAEARVRGAGLTSRTFLTTHGYVVPILGVMAQSAVFCGWVASEGLAWLGVPFLPQLLNFAKEGVGCGAAAVSLMWGGTHLKESLCPSQRARRAASQQ